MDKVRKFIERLWIYKERLLFAVVICILGWRVYNVVNPPPIPVPPKHPFPGKTPPPAESEMPPPPPAQAAAQWKTIYTPNPFWYLASQTNKTDKRDAQQSANIHLRDVKRMANGSCKAQLQTTAKKWWSEGDKFENFEVLKIDPDSQTCQVYSEREGRVLNLNLER